MQCCGIAAPQAGERHLLIVDAAPHWDILPPPGRFRHIRYRRDGPFREYREYSCRYRVAGIARSSKLPANVRSSCAQELPRATFPGELVNDTSRHGSEKVPG